MKISPFKMAIISILFVTFTSSIASAWSFGEFWHKIIKWNEPTVTVTTPDQTALIPGSDPCMSQLQIQSVEPAGFKSSDVGPNTAMLGGEFDLQLKAVGKPPFTWTVRSKTEDFWNAFETIYCTDASRCMPCIWDRSANCAESAVTTGDTLDLRATFSNGLIYCETARELREGETRDADYAGYILEPRGCAEPPSREAAVIPPGMPPPLPETFHLGETLTVTVTDSCSRREPLIKKFGFELTAPEENSENIIAAQMIISGERPDPNDYMALNLYDREDRLVAHSYTTVGYRGIELGLGLPEEPWWSQIVVPITQVLPGTRIQDIVKAEVVVQAYDEDRYVKAKIRLILLYTKYRYANIINRMDTTYPDTIQAGYCGAGPTHVVCQSRRDYTVFWQRFHQPLDESPPVRVTSIGRFKE